MTGSNAPTTHSPLPCPPSSRISTTMNQYKADPTDVARILRCPNKLIENLKAADKKSRETKVAKAPGEEIMAEALTKTPLRVRSRTTPSRRSPLSPGRWWRCTP